MASKGDVSYVLSSNKRVRILLHLSKSKVDRPANIAKELNDRISAISREILNLQKRNLLEPLEPERKSWRNYELTQKGESVIKTIESLPKKNVN